MLILEDNPYGDLRVSGENVPTVKSMDEDGIVIYAGSFSKVLAPGIRVAYVIAPEPIVAKMTVCKQGQDVHTAMFNQMLVYEWMSTTDFEAHIGKIRDIYRRKMTLMCDLIDEKLGDLVSYVRPEGGMFVWCELPEKSICLTLSSEPLRKRWLSFPVLHLWWRTATPLIVSV